MKAIAVLAMAAGFIACTPMGSGKEPACVSIRFFNVGQGDASLVEMPSGEAFLIDCGPDSCGLDTLLGGRRLSGLVITHAHADHYGGVRMILKQYRVDRVWLAPFREDRVPPDYLQTVRWITDTLKIDTAMASAGRTLNTGGAVFLSPAGPDTSGADEGINGASCVLLFTFGKSGALFAGDAGFETEKRLLREGSLKPVLVLKAGHHGSATSTSTAFLSSLLPEAIVISVGVGNGYGHPDGETLARMAACGASVFRTDINGTIRIQMNEEGELLVGEKD